MWRFLFLVLLIFAPYLTYADTSGFYTVEQDALFSNFKSDSELIQSRDLQKIRDFINKEDPEFIGKISSLSEREQIVQMRNYTAKKAFDYYYDKYVAELEQKSQETGRGIIEELYETQVLWWLDRGDIDSKECIKNGFRLCDYPDGFEEYMIRLQKYDDTAEDGRFSAELFIMKDDIANNSSTYITIILDIDEYKGISNNNVSLNASLWLNANVNVQKYNDNHRWRNQDIADTRADKYRKPTKKERRKWKRKYKGSPFSKLGIVTDDSHDWKSSWIPSSVVKGLSTTWRMQSNYTEITE